MITNRWDKTKADLISDDLAMRVYSSQLLGRDENLVLHGGGNTSVKIGEELFVKGSGWDLATIEKAGFPAVKIDALLELLKLDELSDIDMVKAQKDAMIDKSAPNPSVEAILHAYIPYKFVDHTHADSIATISATPNGAEKLAEIYGKSVLIVPYVMPGFVLAKTIYNMTHDLSWQDLEAIILLNHGIFTFADNAEESYDKMISMVNIAEKYISDHYKPETKQFKKLIPDQLIGDIKNILPDDYKVELIDSDEAYKFAHLENVAEIARGCLTPEHILRTKLYYMVSNQSDLESALAKYQKDYDNYFAKYASDQTKLDNFPRVIVIRNCAVLAVCPKNAKIVADIAHHTIKSILIAENLGGWSPLDEQSLFDIEYWSLEQAKLGKK